MSQEGAQGFSPTGGLARGREGGGGKEGGDGKEGGREASFQCGKTRRLYALGAGGSPDT